MKHIFIFASLSIFGFSIINPQYASYIYIIWAASFVLMYLGWSLFYGIIMLVTMASYFYTDLTSPDNFYSSILPWFSGILALFIFFSLIFRYARIFGGNSQIDPTDGVSSGYSDNGGGDGL